MRSLPAVVDQRAAENPDGLCGKTSAYNDGKLSWTDISWIQLSRAVDRMAHWIDSQLGRPAENEATAYIGINDVRYPILILASLKTGYKALLASPRNSFDAQLSLLQSTGCCKFLYTAEFKSQVDVLSRSVALHSAQVPDVQDLLHSTNVEPYSETCSLQPHDCAFILHSSGSTGAPKPIYIRAGALSVAEILNQIDSSDGEPYMHQRFYDNTTMISMLPFFHIMGILVLLRSIYHEGKFAILPPGHSPTAELMVDAINSIRPGYAFYAPSMLEEMCRAPNGLDALSKLDVVFYGGAPLAQYCGDQITKVTHLQICFGTTETGGPVPNYLTKNPEDWGYFEWSENAGIFLEPETDTLFELVLKRQLDSQYQGIFFNYPELFEWRTKDLFERHPTKTNLWRCIGRKDDLIVFSNGEKTNPILFEKIVDGHPWVKGSLVVGVGRFQAGLIIEPHGNYFHMDEKSILDAIWARIEEANNACPAYAKVWPSMVTIAAEEKPFKRSPKGSIVRQATYKLYEEEIASLYRSQNASNLEPEVDGPVSFANVRDVVRKALSLSISRNAANISDDDDFFTNGFDSLQVLQLSTTVSGTFNKLASGGDICPPRMVYQNSSVHRLSKAVYKTMNNNIEPPSTRSREEKMSAMIYKYTKSLPVKRTEAPFDLSLMPSILGLASLTSIKRLVESTSSTFWGLVQSKPSGKHTVLLTGSTGFLGTYLLHHLLANPAFEHIYCLNRSEGARERQEINFLDRSLDCRGFTSKVTFLTGDMGKEDFGLSSKEFQKVKESVDVVIHNAWPVNFNNDLEYFETTAVVGVRRCVDFAITAERRPHIIFTSSIASVGNWLSVRDDRPVPEAFDNDACLPLPNGYGESKHVASSILANATQVSGVNATILRLGQLAGPVTGCGIWNKAEWLPSLIATSKSLRKIPRTLGSQNVIDWVPVDVVAQGITDHTLFRLHDPSGRSLDCFNISNPKTANWEDLVGGICEFYHQQGDKLEVVEFDDWIQELSLVEMTTENIARYPGMKLLDFYKVLGKEENQRVHMATENSFERSRSLAALQPVNAGLMAKWLTSWAF